MPWTSLIFQSGSNMLPVCISTSRNASPARNKTHLLPAKSLTFSSQLFIFFCFQLLMAARGKKKRKVKGQVTTTSFKTLFIFTTSVLSKNLREVGFSLLSYLQNSGQAHSKASPKIRDAEPETSTCGTRRKGSSH